jgi:hypothetical protein
MKLQYREIVRAAKRLNKKFGGGYGSMPDDRSCAVGMVGWATLGEGWWHAIRKFRKEDDNHAVARSLGRAIGVKEEALVNLECGYEGLVGGNRKHPQYKVGQRLRTLRGNPF